MKRYRSACRAGRLGRETCRRVGRASGHGGIDVRLTGATWTVDKEADSTIEQG